MTDLENPFWGDGWNEIRAMFPRLQPGHAYLNHGGFGNAPETVLAVQGQWKARMDANATHFFRRELEPGLEAARMAASEFLGAPDNEGLALVGNATTAIALAIGTVPLEAGDEVLVTDHEYPTTTWAADRACRDVGAKLVTVGIPLAADAARIVELVLAAVTPRTKLAVLDHVTSQTARRFPIEELIPALRERGVVVAIDGAHAPGMLPVDLAALDPDFYGGNLHKWAYAPRTVAAFYVAPRWRPLVRNPIVSWNEAIGFPHNVMKHGSSDYTPQLASPAGIGFIRAFGEDRVREHNVKLAEYGQAALAAALDVDPAELPGDPGVPMRVVPLPGAIDESRDLQIEISDQLGVEVSVPLWNGRTLIRVSANVYNAPAEYDRLAEGIASVL